MTGAISRYGSADRKACAHVRRRRRRGQGAASAASAAWDGTWLLDTEGRVPGHGGYGRLRVSVMLSLAVEVASLIESLPVRMRASIVRRTFPFSTSTQCFAVGTNQLRLAARSFTLFPSRLVAFGMLPFAWSVFSASVFVKSLIQSFASDLSFDPFGTARSDPPRKPGIDCPALWPGITNCAVTFLYFLPTQQLNHAGPTIDAACPCAYTSYGCGRSSVPVLLAREVALKKRL